MRTQTQTPTWMGDFLTDLARHGYVSKAARAVGVSCTIVTRHRRMDSTFDAAVTEAMGTAPAEAREITYS